MYKQLFRFLALLLLLFTVCGTVQATILQLNVFDNVDNSTVPRATVFIDGSNAGKTNNVGRFYLTHSDLNDVVIRVSMTGFDDWSELIAANVTAKDIYLVRKSLKLKVTVVDSDTLAPVPNVDITLTADNASQSHKTDVTGITTFNVRGATLYTIGIIAPNYQPRSGTVDVMSSDVEVQYSLLSGNRFSFIVRDQDNMPLENAEVRIDTILAGKTDARGILTSNIGRGKTYTIEVKKEGYQPYTTTRQISETDALMNIQLTKALVGIFIYVVDESNAPIGSAEVMVNAESKGSSNQYGRITLNNLVAGAYNIDIKKDGFVRIQKSITVTKQGEEFTIQLPYEKVDMAIFVQDKDKKVIPESAVFIDGEKRGMTDANGQLATKVTLNRAYNITAAKDGYQQASVQKDIRQGIAVPVSLTITLEKNTDWGFIALVIIGAVGVILVFALIRHMSRKPRRHLIRKNEI